MEESLLRHQAPSRGSSEDGGSHAAQVATAGISYNAENPQNIGDLESGSYDIYEDLLKGRSRAVPDWTSSVGTNEYRRSNQKGRKNQSPNAERRAAGILRLPAEVMDLVLDYACTACPDLIRLGVVNRSFLHISRTTRLWTQLPVSKHELDLMIPRICQDSESSALPAARYREQFLRYSYNHWKAHEVQRRSEQRALKYENVLVYCKNNKTLIRSIFVSIAFVNICMWGVFLGARSIRLWHPIFLHLGIVGLYISCLIFPAWCLFDFAISRISSYHPSAEIRTAFEGPQFTKPMVTATVFFGVGAALTIMLGHIKIAIGERSSGPVSKLSWSLTMMPLYVISIIVSLTIGVRIVISEFRKPDSAKTVLATFVAIFVGGTLAIACALISYRQDELDRGKDQPYGVAECLAPVLFHICCVVSHSLYLIVAMRKRLKYRFHWTSATALALELVAIASLGTILLLSFDPYFAWTTEYNYWFYVAIILACKLIALVLAHSNRDYI